MYLRPSSDILGKIVPTQETPLHLRHRLLDGYHPVYWKAMDASILTQYYNHKEVDIYIHSIKANKIIRLFSSMSINRFVLGWLRKGNATLFGHDSTSLDLTAPTNFYFRSIVGKEFFIDFQTGQHELICCCLTSDFESVLREWYPIIAGSEMPPKQWSPSYLTQYLWEELISGEIPIDLYRCFVAERIRTLLRHLMSNSISDQQVTDWEKLHPGIPTSVLEKAYLAKQYIDNQNGQPITLNQLVRMVRWNLTGLKRGFVETFGVSPRQYMIKKTLGEAMKLVQMTDIPIKTIAKHLGYKQTHHFIHQFKALYGKTPGVMRK